MARSALALSFAFAFAACMPSAPVGNSDGGAADLAHSSADLAGADLAGADLAESCLGAALLAGLGRDHVLAGASMEDAVAAQAPFDLRYIYISGGLFDGAAPCQSCASGCTAGGASCANANPNGCAWWGCWQWDQVPPGQYLVDFAKTAQGDSQIPMVTYYQILQASQVQEGTAEVTVAARDAKFMARYFADWRFLLQKIGAANAFLHIEPDFWGYAEQAGGDPHALAAAVASANPTDCATEEDSIAGLGRCLIAMARKYAPNARVGLHASSWGTKTPALENKDPNFDVAADARKLADFLAACGAADGDYIVADASDRDAGYYQSLGRDTWWDAANQTLPDFHQAFAWSRALAERLGRPVVWWQLPVGNAAQDDTPDHWKDNRVDYFFAHADEVAAGHGVAMAFGAGAGGQTTPSTDGGNLVARVKAYAAAGGQRLCP